MARVAVAAQQRAAVGMGYVCVTRFMAAADRQASNTCSMQPAAQTSTGQLIATQARQARASMLLKSMREESVAKVASSSTRGSTTSLRYPMLRGRQAGRQAGRQYTSARGCTVRAGHGKQRLGPKTSVGSHYNSSCWAVAHTHRYVWWILARSWGLAMGTTSLNTACSSSAAVQAPNVTTRQQHEASGSSSTGSRTGSGTVAAVAAALAVAQWPQQRRSWQALGRAGQGRGAGGHLIPQEFSVLWPLLRLHICGSSSSRRQGQVCS